MDNKVYKGSMNKKRGYSFQRTNKLLNKHGKAYRKQDVKQKRGMKRRAVEEEEKEEKEEKEVVQTEITDSYSELISSLKKKPRVYFEELLANEAEGSDDEDKIEEEEEDSEVREDGSEDEEAEITDNKRFITNFGNDVPVKKASKPPLITAPCTLYNVLKPSDVTITNTELRTPDDLLKHGLEPSLVKQWVSAAKQVKSKGVMKPVSAALFPYISNGQDVLFTDSNFDNQNEMLKLLALHVLDHVFKTRRTVLKNNSKLSSGGNTEDFKDQGYTRPKVLVLFPFRNVAHRFVQQIFKLALAGAKKQVSNKKRFDEEYGPGDLQKPNLTKSISYQKTFLGNNDDFFTLGIAFAKNSVKLYTDFYNSDLIVASPLGIRSVIGAQGDKERDYDFLSSIEVLSLFMSDVFLMQNWDHLLHCLEHLNLQPTSTEHTDFSRVKSWVLEGHGKLYRQNLVFSSLKSPAISALFNTELVSHRGLVRVTPFSCKDVLSQILYPVRQVFSRIRDRRSDETLVEYLTTGRYQYFIDNVLPRFQNNETTAVVIVIPSYYDFVRIRNYFKKEGLKFSQLSEYSTNKSITNIRRWFSEGDVKYLLTTERFFFFKRYALRGVREVLFYESPVYGECYAHYLNMLSGDHALSTLLYSKLDGERLERLVGAEQCKQLVNSNQTTHILMSE